MKEKETLDISSLMLLGESVRIDNPLDNSFSMIYDLVFLVSYNNVFISKAHYFILNIKDGYNQLLRYPQ